MKIEKVYDSSVSLTGGTNDDEASVSCGGLSAATDGLEDDRDTIKVAHVCQPPDVMDVEEEEWTCPTCGLVYVVGEDEDGDWEWILI